MHVKVECYYAYYGMEFNYMKPKTSLLWYIYSRPKVTILNFIHNRKFISRLQSFS